MEAPKAGACAAIVARDDPHLHATALFAPEPGRSRLMVLYAFDVELSRATQASAESLIPRMRLQWWRDVAGAADDGAPPPAHEVAGPLARLVAVGALPAESVEALISAREAELEGGFDTARFNEWAENRFGALTALAAGLLSEDKGTVALAGRAGPVLGAAFALRHAASMAMAGRVLLPGLGDADWAALAGGDLTDHAAAVVRELAAQGLDALAVLRAARGRADRNAVPAFLPLARAGRVLAQAARLRSGEGSAAGLAGLDGGRGFEGLRLAWRAGSGRW